MGGCKVCGKRMLTPELPLIRRTCEDCKAEQAREHNRKVAARRKAERHAAKQKLGKPRCEQCGKPIKGGRAARLYASGARGGRANSAATLVAKPRSAPGAPDEQPHSVSPVEAPVSELGINRTKRMTRCGVSRWHATQSSLAKPLSERECKTPRVACQS